MDQVQLSPQQEKAAKNLDTSDLDQFTKKEVKEFLKYNSIVNELDSKYTGLSFRNRKVLVRMFVKDFAKNDGKLHYSKTEYLKIASGIDEGVIYDEFPNPYPFTRKAVVISSDVMGLEQGMVVSLTDKPTVAVGKQDSGYVIVRGGFIHPDYDEDYTQYPQDPLDTNYGYILIDEQNIELIYK